MFGNNDISFNLKLFSPLRTPKVPDDKTKNVKESSGFDSDVSVVTKSIRTEVKSTTEKVNTETGYDSDPALFMTQLFPSQRVANKQHEISSNSSSDVSSSEESDIDINELRKELANKAKAKQQTGSNIKGKPADKLEAKEKTSIQIAKSKKIMNSIIDKYVASGINRKSLAPSESGNNSDRDSIMWADQLEKKNIMGKPANKVQTKNKTTKQKAQDEKMSISSTNKKITQGDIRKSSDSNSSGSEDNSDSNSESDANEPPDKLENKDQMSNQSTNSGKLSKPNTNCDIISGKSDDSNNSDNTDSESESDASEPPDKLETKNNTSQQNANSEKMSESNTNKNITSSVQRKSVDSDDSNNDSNIDSDNPSGSDTDSDSSKPPDKMEMKDETAKQNTNSGNVLKSNTNDNITSGVNRKTSESDMSNSDDSGTDSDRSSDSNKQVDRLETNDKATKQERISENVFKSNTNEGISSGVKRKTTDSASSDSNNNIGSESEGNSDNDSNNDSGSDSDSDSSKPSDKVETNSSNMDTSSGNVLKSKANENITSGVKRKSSESSNSDDSGSNSDSDSNKPPDKVESYDKNSKQDKNSGSPSKSQTNVNITSGVKRNSVDSSNSDNIGSDSDSSKQPRKKKTKLDHAVPQNAQISKLTDSLTTLQFSPDLFSDSDTSSKKRINTSKSLKSVKSTGPQLPMNTSPKAVKQSTSSLLEEDESPMQVDRNFDDGSDSDSSTKSSIISFKDGNVSTIVREEEKVMQSDDVEMQLNEGELETESKHGYQPPEGFKLVDPVSRMSMSEDRLKGKQLYLIKAPAKFQFGNCDFGEQKINMKGSTTLTDKKSNTEYIVDVISKPAKQIQSYRCLNVKKSGAGNVLTFGKALEGAIQIRTKPPQLQQSTYTRPQKTTHKVPDVTRPPMMPFAYRSPVRETVTEDIKPHSHKKKKKKKLSEDVDNVQLTPARSSDVEKESKKMKKKKKKKIKEEKDL